jgi:RNA polymerase sigma factor (sigma-70 family)
MLQGDIKVSEPHESITILALSARTCNALMRAGITTIELLTSRTAEDILALHHIGRKCFGEIQDKLNELGLTFAQTTQSQPNQDADSLIALDLSDEAFYPLWWSDIQTITKLTMQTEAQLLALPSMTRQALDEIKEKLAAHGLSLVIRFPLLESSLAVRLEQKDIPLDKVPILSLRLSTRARGRLVDSGITTLAQLVQLGEDDLLDIRGFGRGCLSELREKLNLSIKDILEKPLDWQKVEATVQAKHTEQQEAVIDWANITLPQLLDRLFVSLNEREREVLCLRYGLSGDSPCKLEQIGQRFGLTRERIRQIQVRALKKLQHARRRKLLSEITNRIHAIFVDHGGVLSGQELGRVFAELLPMETIDPENAALFFVELDSRFTKIGRDDLWGIAEYPLDCVSHISNMAVEILTQSHVPVLQEMLVSKLHEHPSMQDLNEKAPIGFLQACIRTCPKVRVDDAGVCTLAKWEQSPIDVAILTMNSSQCQMHYAEITSLVNKVLPEHKQVSKEYMHNLLDSHVEIFYHFGRGEYGLREWLFSQENTGSFSVHLDSLAQRIQQREEREQSRDAAALSEVERIRQTGTTLFDRSWNGHSWNVSNDR